MHGKGGRDPAELASKANTKKRQESTRGRGTLEYEKTTDKNYKEEDKERQERGNGIEVYRREKYHREASGRRSKVADDKREEEEDSKKKEEGYRLTRV